MEKRRAQKIINRQRGGKETCIVLDRLPIKGMSVHHLLKCLLNNIYMFTYLLVNIINRPRSCNKTYFVHERLHTKGLSVYHLLKRLIYLYLYWLFLSYKFEWLIIYVYSPRLPTLYSNWTKWAPNEMTPDSFYVWKTYLQIICSGKFSVLRVHL